MSRLMGKMLLILPAVLVFIAFFRTLSMPIFRPGNIPVAPEVRQEIARDYPEAILYDKLDDDVVFPYSIKTYGLWHVMKRPLIPGYPYWRPIGLIAFKLDGLIWGLRPFGYHFDNLLLHALNCYLLIVLVAFLTGSRKLALGASCAYAVFPYNSIFEATSIKFDVLCGTFLLCSGISFVYFLRGEKGIKATLALSLLFFLLALGTKETAVAFPLFLFALVLFELKGKRDLRKLLVVLTFILFAYGFLAIGNSMADGGGAGSRIAQYLQYHEWPEMARRSFATIFPTVRNILILTALWSTADLWMLPRLLPATVMYIFTLLALILAMKRESRILGIFFLWTVIMYLPVAPFAFGGIGQKQYGYIPYMGEIAIVALCAIALGDWMVRKTGRRFYSYLPLPILIANYLLEILCRFSPLA